MLTSFAVIYMTNASEGTKHEKKKEGSGGGGVAVIESEGKCGCGRGSRGTRS